MQVYTTQQIIQFFLLVISLIQLILLIILCIKKNDKRDNSQFSLLLEEQSRTRKELANNLISFSKLLSGQQERIRQTVEKKLTDIQQDNSHKLDQMRETVDEKLQKTLEVRLGESFKLVSMQLERVQKGLGEMQSLASGVGDLKRVLSNVKSKGVLGEYQLRAIFEEIMTPEQYSCNVKTKKGSDALVEFAVRIPGRSVDGSFIWLPVDAKFPTTDYERLTEAYTNGDNNAITSAVKELEKKIRVFAKDIHVKYVSPPDTTDFAILFLPFEGLYAEVLRIPGLFESIQKEYKVTITGPTTISAFLNSLQMGFRTLAVEKRTDEIWTLLGRIRNEFGQFGEILDKTRLKLEAASKEIENAGTRSRAIERKLRDVETLPGTKFER